jgi:hypothetical protein
LLGGFLGTRTEAPGANPLVGIVLTLAPAGPPP